MDPIKQAKAICNDGVSVTALQQQLAELKGKACGLESVLRSGLPTAAAPCFPELAPIKTRTSATTGENALASLIGILPGSTHPPCVHGLD